MWQCASDRSLVQGVIKLTSHALSPLKNKNKQTGITAWENGKVCAGLHNPNTSECNKMLNRKYKLQIN